MVHRDFSFWTYLTSMNYDAIIVGGGLAGLTASVCLSKAGLSVLVLEKSEYPHHKVCGEYVSNEVRSFLEYLGIDLEHLGAVPIRNFSISNEKGRKLSTQLPLGGFGISRYALDNALYELALKQGVELKFQTVYATKFLEDSFLVSTKDMEFKSRFVIGAHGKRSLMDKSMNRKFIKEKSPWLGVKCHYEYKGFPEDEVALHCFPGGYGGLSMTESGHINFCYLAHHQNFKHYKNVDAFGENVLSKNPFLQKFLGAATPVFKSSLSIGQISFAKKSPVEDHVLMCGDSAGLIHPLCGNGMAMAIHAAKIASDIVTKAFKQKEYPRTRIEKEYIMQWETNFRSRLYYGRKIQSWITNPIAVNGLFSIIPNSEKILTAIIKRTHGKPILV
ncbi:MAG: NAD(P)/FAD-dependent oxidoreductase [Bacteroidota bacterium]